jgi:transcriptional regulator with XRE-family HTH domain
MERADPPGNLRERVLAAWRALPHEGKRDQPPSFRALEKQHGLPSGIFSRILSGHTAEIKHKNAERMATALNVSLSWLLTGEGAEEPPKSTPQHSSEAARDLAAEWARWEKIDERAIQMVLAGPLYPYSPRVWLSLMIVYAANLSLGQSVSPTGTDPLHP